MLMPVCDGGAGRHNCDLSRVQPAMAQQHPKVSDFLCNLPLFRELDPAEIDRLAQGTSVVHAPRGQTLFRKGDPCDGFHVVVYGQVKLYFMSPQGAEKVIEIVGPGQSFGEAIMFTDTPYIVFGETLADAMLLHVSKRTVFEELEHDPRFARKMIAGLSRRLHRLASDVEDYSLRSGTQRVIGYLLTTAEELADSPAARVELPVSKSVVASRLNLTPEHFSRVLHDLSEAGLIRVNGRTIDVPDLEGLRGHQR